VRIQGLISHLSLVLFAPSPLLSLSLSLSLSF
jgi:hypothetical protein